MKIKKIIWLVVVIIAVVGLWRFFGYKYFVQYNPDDFMPYPPGSSSK